MAFSILGGGVPHSHAMALAGEKKQTIFGGEKKPTSFGLKVDEFWETPNGGNQEVDDGTETASELLGTWDGSTKTCQLVSPGMFTIIGGGGGGWSSASCKSLKNPLIRPARFPGGKRATLTKKSPLFRYYVLKKDKQYNTTQVIPAVTKLHPQALEVTMKPFKGVTEIHHPKKVTFSQNCQVTSFAPKWATKKTLITFLKTLVV